MKMKFDESSVSTAIRPTSGRDPTNHIAQCCTQRKHRKYAKKADKTDDSEIEAGIVGPGFTIDDLPRAFYSRRGRATRIKDSVKWI